MKKIISLFQRNYGQEPRYVRDEVTPGAEWVISGEGVATRKWDGTCCLIRDGKLYKRYDAKAFTIGRDGEKQPWNRKPPDGFEPAQDPDPVTGHWPGWLLVGDGPEDKWHREALSNYERMPADGTYELCGPKVQGNPEGFLTHAFVRHGCDILPDFPRDFEGIKAYLQAHDFEGVVWWRDLNDPNCDKVKIKKRDFSA